jgi:hypothetical protein
MLQPAVDRSETGCLLFHRPISCLILHGISDQNWEMLVIQPTPGNVPQNVRVLGTGKLCQEKSWARRFLYDRDMPRSRRGQYAAQ